MVKGFFALSVQLMDWEARYWNNLRSNMFLRTIYLRCYISICQIAGSITGVGHNIILVHILSKTLPQGKNTLINEYSE